LSSRHVANAKSYCDANSHSYSYSYRHTDRHSNRDIDSYTQAYSVTKSHPISEGAPYASAPVASSLVM
jgi:hypothetical protein